MKQSKRPHHFNSSNEQTIEFVMLKNGKIVPATKTQKKLKQHTPEPKISQPTPKLATKKPENPTQKFFGPLSSIADTFGPGKKEWKYPHTIETVSGTYIYSSPTHRTYITQGYKNVEIFPEGGKAWVVTMHADIHPAFQNEKEKQPFYNIPLKEVLKAEPKHKKEKPNLNKPQQKIR